MTEGTSSRWPARPDDLHQPVVWLQAKLKLWDVRGDRWVPPVAIRTGSSALAKASLAVLVFLPGLASCSDTMRTAVARRASSFAAMVEVELNSTHVHHEL